MNAINREMQRYKGRGKYADSCIQYFAVVARDFLQALPEGAAIS